MEWSNWKSKRGIEIHAPREAEEREGAALQDQGVQADTITTRGLSIYTGWELLFSTGSRYQLLGTKRDVI
jgi:hypothetical protein